MGDGVQQVLDQDLPLRVVPQGQSRVDAVDVLEANPVPLYVAGLLKVTDYLVYRALGDPDVISYLPSSMLGL